MPKAWVESLRWRGNILIPPIWQCFCLSSHRPLQVMLRGPMGWASPFPALPVFDCSRRERNKEKYIGFPWSFIRLITIQAKSLFLSQSSSHNIISILNIKKERKKKKKCSAHLIRSCYHYLPLSGPEEVRFLFPPLLVVSLLCAAPLHSTSIQKATTKSFLLGSWVMHGTGTSKIPAPKSKIMANKSKSW